MAYLCDLFVFFLDLLSFGLSLFICFCLFAVVLLLFDWCLLIFVIRVPVVGCGFSEVHRLAG